MTSFLLVVFDGLRPDMVRPQTTPNLLRFAALGTRFAHARSVFPSETRVCSASVATGCLPRRHGLVANRIAHPLDPTRTVDTGDMQALRALEQDTGEAVLAAPMLAELLAAGGRDCAVLSSGTTGQTFVLNPRADALGQVTLSAHGAQACSAAGRALLEGLPPPPPAPAARAAWIADAFRTRLLADPPAATILWLCEPDTTGHYGGLGSPAQLAALQTADAAFGRILDAWQAGPHRDRLHIAVASDHGHATVSGHADVGAALAGLPAFADCTLLAGSSGGIFVPGGGAERNAALAEWLTRQDWCGAIYAADGAELPPGVLPRSVLLADHRRAAHVLYTLRTNAGPSAMGLPGITLFDGALAPGAGTHGGLLSAELHTVLMLAGSRIRAGAVSEWPAGLTDIAPTALALLGLGGGGAMDGRVLAEAFVDGAEPADSPAPESWEAAGPGYRQRLARTRLGPHVYLDEGQRD
ncbi:alkaline phosphatase family protein [Limobrevibacterium gyesilva]|uniref:Alkaline phosphatase family protein n=1 Tax=Limobrevibacterium gyesilva TaxID=2991712 RepID=A0AA41YKA2_9PROT|nr:alkaline phosphatase family protein [Limobrevibacterium gyesilva]MCW3473722.1 alkaline phosphatase family protein [Limobrevibacterium gyesilva]